MRKLEQIVAPPAPVCDCPRPLWYYELIDGTVYPPEVPCLRGNCPKQRLPGEPPPITAIIESPVRRTKNGFGRAGCEITVEQFRAWDPNSVRPRLRVIVWRDESGRLRYYGPPRWWELETESPRIECGVGVPATDDEIIEELRRTDDTPPIGSPCFKHYEEETMDEGD